MVKLGALDLRLKVALYVDLSKTAAPLFGSPAVDEPQHAVTAGSTGHDPDPLISGFLSCAAPRYQGPDGNFQATHDPGSDELVILQLQFRNTSRSRLGFCFL